MISGGFIRTGAACDCRVQRACRGRAALQRSKNPNLLKPFKTTLQLWVTGSLWTRGKKSQTDPEKRHSCLNCLASQIRTTLPPGWKREKVIYFFKKPLPCLFPLQLLTLHNHWLQAWSQTSESLTTVWTLSNRYYQWMNCLDIGTFF